MTYVFKKLMGAVEKRDCKGSGGTLIDVTVVAESGQWEEKQWADIGPVLKIDCKGLPNALDGKREGREINFQGFGSTKWADSGATNRQIWVRQVSWVKQELFL